MTSSPLVSRTDTRGSVRSIPPRTYLAYVDGRPRLDGVHRFLAARGVQLREGEPTDGPQAMTVHGLGARQLDQTS
jgi:hypothetical protein